MFDPQSYEANKSVPDKLNFVYVPKIIDAMSWNFTEGNILDYGCGPGSTGYKLILPHVEATNSLLFSNDISTKMVEFARSTFPHSRITYETGNFPDTFPFENVEFDKIFSVNVFHFINDIVPTLEAIVKVLKPGGQFGFTTTTINTPAMTYYANLPDDPVWGTYFTDAKKYIPEWSDNKDFPLQDFYRDIFIEKTGMKSVIFEVSTTKVEWGTDVMLDVAMSMNPCVGNIPRNLLPDFRKHLRKLLTQMLGYTEKAEKVVVPMEYICAVLEKPKPEKPETLRNLSL